MPYRHYFSEAGVVDHEVHVCTICFDRPPTKDIHFHLHYNPLVKTNHMDRQASSRVTFHQQNILQAGVVGCNVCNILRDRPNISKKPHSINSKDPLLKKDFRNVEISFRKGVFRKNISEAGIVDHGNCGCSPRGGQPNMSDGDVGNQFQNVPLLSVARSWIVLARHTDWKSRRFDDICAWSSPANPVIIQKDFHRTYPLPACEMF